MSVMRLVPECIIESSWEVCNKVGGIYTVLSTRAKTLQNQLSAQLIFIGPDVWLGKNNPLFVEDTSLFDAWKSHARIKDGLNVRIGRWTIPGNPIAVLVDFMPFFEQKNAIYAEAWNNDGVDSLHAYGDYDEASMFSYAAGKVVESFFRYQLKSSGAVVYQAHEWMTGLGALYVKHHVPEIATIFTTHATSIGRSIAGNQKPLYDYLSGYNGDQMARELNMESKHSIEKQTAHHVDCFTTVSEITNRECAQLLEKKADVVLVNGFEDDFVPKGPSYSAKRKRIRATVLNVANKLLGTQLGDDTLIIGTGGRYEFRNKGLDVYLQSLKELNEDSSLSKNVLAFINVPAWTSGPRADLSERLSNSNLYTSSLPTPFLTHWLHNLNEDRVLGMLNVLGLHNSVNDKVKVIFVPCYLNGNDGIFNLTYYDLLIGNDMGIYPSYYEPWGYTPLESAAFHVPTLTTDLAGFGLWVQSLHEGCGELKDGVKVVHRTDGNYYEVTKAIKDTVVQFSQLSADEVKKIRQQAANITEKALWKHFIRFYQEAYSLALTKVQERKNEQK